MQDRDELGSAWLGLCVSDHPEMSVVKRKQIASIRMVDDDLQEQAQLHSPTMAEVMIFVKMFVHTLQKTSLVTLWVYIALSALNARLSVSRHSVLQKAVCFTYPFVCGASSSAMGLSQTACIR